MYDYCSQRMQKQNEALIFYLFSVWTVHQRKDLSFVLRACAWDPVLRTETCSPSVYSMVKMASLEN